jgi:hypothetical protein
VLRERIDDLTLRVLRITSTSTPAAACESEREQQCDRSFSIAYAASQPSALGNGTVAGSSSTKIPDDVRLPHMQQCMPRNRSRLLGFGTGSGQRTRVGGLTAIVQHWSQIGCAHVIRS